MKRYFVKFTAFCLALALPFAAYFGWVQAKPAMFTDSIMGTVHHKLELLETTPGPRVILAGGSSSPYATDCEAISAVLGVPVINVGATVYLGLDFYISMLEEHMQQGDTIVLAPEHVMLEGNELGYHMVWMAAENSGDVWHVVPKSYLPGMARAFYGYSQDKLKRYNDGVQPAGYHAEFGPFGDVTAQRESLLEQGYNTEDPIALDANTLSDEVVQKLNRFYARCKKAGVQLLFAFAPVDELALTTTQKDWAALEGRIRTELDMPVLGSLKEAILPGELFYNSNNHLTTEGAALYSASLAEALQDQL